MRRFHSYGPVDCERHFCVPRQALVEQCLDHIVDNPDKGGHYFTIWAPRQTGKTWLMHQVKRAIRERYGERFIVATMSMQGVVDLEDKPVEAFLERVPSLIWMTFKTDIDKPTDWDGWLRLFRTDSSLIDRPLILFIDEFDKLPPPVIDRLVNLFRDMYLARDAYLLHGLALIGVRAVLGLESSRGSPFNVQRALHVANFTEAEVNELFRQYTAESGQPIEPEIVAELYRVTRGQPGLIGWFGELLTETYNPGAGKVIDADTWESVYVAAMDLLPNNTVMNLVAKARTRYTEHVLQLFAKADIPFKIDQDWCNYLYMNGIIDSAAGIDDLGRKVTYTRFSSPFVQERLYSALAYDFIGERLPILALDFTDTLEDVFGGETLDLPALLQRYTAFLLRLKAKGLNPWQDQPRRTNLNITEWVGHFHLFTWLQAAVGRRCAISPEFPTGNGRVDIHLNCKDGKAGIIEVKSFSDAAQVKKDREQAAGYAQQLGMQAVTVALFIPSEDEKVLSVFAGREDIDGVTVTVVPVGLTG